jgi:serine/threonine protein kinase
MDLLREDFNSESTIEDLYQKLNNIFLHIFQYDDILNKASTFEFKNESYRKQAKRDIEKEIYQRDSYAQFFMRDDSSYKDVDDIIFENQSYKDIDLVSRKFKIIDYGNCYDYSDERYGLINTRQYRAPEVILSNFILNTLNYPDYKNWCEKTDIWSFGCLIFELYKGGLCFPTHESYHHLAIIQKR